jgi:DNA-binding NtrC family response regulator
MVEAGSFREDLYYRLKGARIEIPSLRQRRGDISKLAIHFLTKFGQNYHKHWIFTPEALRVLQGHDWPGNVRELEHVVRESAMLSRGKKIGPDDLELLPRRVNGSIPDPYIGFKLEEYLASVREKLFQRALELAEGKQAQAARLLGVSDAAVSKFVKQQE